jgi:hypothetical protein
MVGNLKATGKQIICMEKEYILGKTVEDMKVNILMIKSKGSVYINGQMVGDMQVSGKTVNNMEKGNMFYQMGWKE